MVIHVVPQMKHGIKKRSQVGKTARSLAARDTEVKDRPVFVTPRTTRTMSRSRFASNVPQRCGARQRAAELATEEPLRRIDAAVSGQEVSEHAYDDDMREYV